jgi:hypothetical protein
MKNLEKFSNWDLNESYSSSSFKWVSPPKNITFPQKSAIEGKMSIHGIDLKENLNFSCTGKAWESLKNRMAKSKIPFKIINPAKGSNQFIKSGEKIIYSDQRPLISKNIENEKVLGYYPSSYKGEALEESWVVGVWENESGKKYLKEMSLKNFLTRSTKDIIKKDFLGTSSVKLDESLQAKINKKDYWTLITIIACENYIDQSQGMADVAQSIYNRYHVKGKPYGKTIADIILTKGQYSPVTKGLKKGADWKNITDRNKAINVYMKSMGMNLANSTKAIDQAVKAQANKSLVDKAKSHVKTRTEFLADKPKGSSAASPVERDSKNKNNSFFWNYAGKTNYYSKNDFKARSIPSEVKIA